MKVSPSKKTATSLSRYKKNTPINHKIAIIFACGVSFFSTFEPNAIIRYGPFFALLAFLLSSPLSLKFGKTEALLFAYVGWSLLSFYWVILPEKFNQNFLLIASNAIIFLGLRAALDRGGLFLIALSYISGNFVGFAITSLGLLQTGLIYTDSSGRITQVGDLNVNPVAYSGVFSVLLLTFFLKNSGSDQKFLRISLLALIGLSAVCVTTTQTRGAMIGLAMIVIGIFLYKIKFSSGLLLISYIVIYTLITLGIFNNFLSIFDKGSRADSGLSGRTQLWNEAGEAWSLRPLQGVGIGGIRGVTDSGLAAHNVFLGIGVALGVIGLLLFIFFISSALTDRSSYADAHIQTFRIILISSAFLPITLSSSLEYSTSGWVALALLCFSGIKNANKNSSQGPLEKSLYSISRQKTL